MLVGAAKSLLVLINTIIKMNAFLTRVKILFNLESVLMRLVLQMQDNRSDVQLRSARHLLVSACGGAGALPHQERRFRQAKGAYIR